MHSAKDCTAGFLNSSTIVRSHRLFSAISVSPASVAFTISSSGKQILFPTSYLPLLSRRCRFFGPAAPHQLLSTLSSVPRTLHTALFMFRTAFCSLINSRANLILYYCLTTTLKCSRGASSVNDMPSSLSKSSSK